MIDWFLILPAIVCALAAYFCGHETLAAARQGEVSAIGAVLTVACAASTLLTIGAMLP